MINLTDQEKIKFIEYLKQEAEASKQIMEQMKKLPESPVMDMIIQKEKNKIVAYLFVAAELDAYEKG
jgi:uncharacterized protein YjgD (DUF1641 family)